MRIGHHVSISGSLSLAATRAVDLGANTLQIFSASPRMWRASMPSEAEAIAFAHARVLHDLQPLVIHDNYLINMASSDDDLRAKSIAAFRGEIERALFIGADYIVAHPGAAKGGGPEVGIHNFCVSLGEAAQGLDTRRLMLLIENTAGAGTILGSRFEEMIVMKQHSANFTDLAVGFCIDTCHSLASGYTMDEMIRQIDGVLGFENVRVIHANDSKGALGSRLDRHEHIGRGYIGIEGFRRVLTHPKLRDKAIIAETPVDAEGDDRRNVQTLISLCQKSRTTTTRSR